MPIHVDSHRLPLLHIRYDGPFSDQELGTYLSQLDDVLRTPGRKVAIIDLLTAVAPPASQRRAQAAWIERNEALLRQNFTATAIVTDSALIRGVVTAIFWVRPLPYPTQVVEGMEAAREWLAPYLCALS
jgi:DNA-binding transcriptional regulator YbjK